MSATIIRKVPPLHLLIFGIAPVLSLYANNADQVPASHVIRSLLLGGILALLSFGFFLLVFREHHKAALITSASLLLFYSYGHIYRILKAVEISGNVLGRHRYLLPASIALWVIALWGIGKWLRDSSRFTAAINLIALSVMVFPTYQLLKFRIQVYTDPTLARTAASSEMCQAEAAEYPDIYYIVLDEYPREDVLLQSFEYDNSDFIDGLSSLGFYVASHSQSNYSQTELSLASSMNFNYLETLSEDFHAGNEDRSGLWHLIRSGQAREILEEVGYRTVAFESGYMWTEVRDADPFIARDRRAMNDLQVAQGFNAFESMLFRTTAGIVITDGAVTLPERLELDLEAPYHDHRERILFVFDKLAELPSLAGPKFVFAHLVTPHQPYVFGPNGEEVENEGAFTLLEDAGMDNQDLQRSRFIDQLIYINRRTEALAAKLIGDSAKPPIVVIQADHGPAGLGQTNRVAIFNAYYLPEEARDALYPTITPVNTFRIILNTALGCRLEMLPDRSHFSSYQDPYAYVLVPTPRAELPGP